MFLNTWVSKSIIKNFTQLSMPEKIQIIQKYFPDLTEKQIQQFTALEALYNDWNNKINVISRKDIDQLYTRHVLHSLSIAQIIKFVPGARILDLGTGGGFPGVPLAILFPEAHFLLVDGTGKKIMVVKEVIKALKLPNAEARQIRAENLTEKFDFVVTRAVAKLDRLLAWTKHRMKKQERHAIPNGLIALKGGDIETEIKALHNREYIEIYPISDFFEETIFEGKDIVYVQS